MQDGVADRLQKARQIGAIAIDFRKGNPAEQIRQLRLNNPLVLGAMRDAVGYQAFGK